MRTHMEIGFNKWYQPVTFLTGREPYTTKKWRKN